MARYGIQTRNALGLPIPKLRKLAKEIGKNHSLSLQLWRTGIHEARILASIIAEPSESTEEQLEEWVKDFNSWDLCDQCCINFFSKTKWTHKKVMDWTKNDSEFIKRAGFVLMVVRAVHDKSVTDEILMKYFSIMEEESDDERNYVKKAVNWALRQIGKRNINLNHLAIRTAQKILAKEARSAKWIASDALRELTSEKIQLQLKAQEQK